jgi:membrane-bound lytic murein transglycosylase D
MTIFMKRFILLVICVTFGTMLVTSCTKGRRVRYSKADRQRFIQMHNLGDLPKSDVPLEINERVIAWMDYFSGSGARHFNNYLERSGAYIPMMRAILKKYGLPQDLVYIALIESGFNNHAHSHASAVGQWQFIGSTARHYGLRVDSWVDERRDPVKSTHAAAQYLKKMYGDYGDWYLVMAGYNAGEGRVNRAIADSGSKNFWVHADPDKKYLKAETRDYVPKYIAATIMAKMPEKFGFKNVEYDKPLDYDVVTIDSQTDLEVAGKCA